MIANHLPVHLFEFQTWTSNLIAEVRAVGLAVATLVQLDAGAVVADEHVAGTSCRQED